VYVHTFVKFMNWMGNFKSCTILRSLSAGRIMETDCTATTKTHSTIYKYVEKI